MAHEVILIFYFLIFLAKILGTDRCLLASLCWGDTYFFFAQTILCFGFRARLDHITMSLCPLFLPQFFSAL